LKSDYLHQKHGSILLFLSLFFSSFVFSQENIRFRHVSIEQGLSQSSVFGMTQDRQGFIWLATEEGANRYNGYEMRIFHHEKGNPASISNNWIYCIYEDQQGNIWFGTDYGLNCFDRETEQFRRFLAQPENPEALISNRIYSLLEDRDGVLWIGSDRGLHSFNKARTKMTRFLFQEANKETTIDNDIRTIIQDQNGAIWVGTLGNGIKCRKVKTGQWASFLHLSSDQNSLLNNNVLSLIQDSDGYIWIGTQGGLDRLDIKHGIFSHYQHDPNSASSLSGNWVNCLFEDREGDLWIGTNDNGLNLYHKKTDRFTKYIYDAADAFSLSTNRVLSIHQDRSGLIWIGLYGGGVNFFQKSAVRFLHVQMNPMDPKSITNNYIRAFLEDGPDRLFLGAQSGGVNIIDKKKGKTIVLDNDPNDPHSIGGNQVFSIVKDKQGTIWMGTFDGGLNRFHSSTQTFTRFQHRPDDPRSLSNDQIRTICPSRDGGLWIGSDGGGFNYFDPKTSQFTRYLADPKNTNSLSMDRVFSLTEDHQSGILWIGTFGGGLNRFDPRTGIFKHYRSQAENPNSLSTDYIGTCIYIDKQGILWIGTSGGGVNRFDPRQETFKNYTSADGLSDNTIYGILEDDDGYFWMSTNQGISKFNPRDLTFKKYDVSDGLQSLEFNGGSYLKSASGWMYFGGIKGYNAFKPKNISDNPYIPPVVLTGMQLFNKAVRIGEKSDGRKILSKAINVTDEITLFYYDRVISFEFAALSFWASEKNQYAYKMEGFDKDWNQVGTRRFASYTNLSPRKYRFLVKASNNDGLWNEKGAALSINIIPPFWQTWWFYLTSSLFMGVTVFSIYKYRINRLKKREKELSAQVEERTYDLNEALKQVEYSNRGLAEANIKLEKLSLTDPLTQLPNRRNFELIFAQEWKRCARESQSLSILMIDIDFFKLYNDTYGHPEGDECLKKVAAVILHNLSRAGDFIARLGGEEFAVILPNTYSKGALAVAEQFRKNIESLNIPHKNSEVASFVTISIGVATIIPENNRPNEMLISMSDQALYQSKKEGRNRVTAKTHINS